jgi:hypothetical protein
VADDALDARLVVDVLETSMAFSSFLSVHLKNSCTQTSCIISLFQERPTNV